MASTTPVGIWFKSSRSDNGTGCVEVRFGSDVTGVRDSKNPGGPALHIGSGAWAGFVGTIKDRQLRHRVLSAQAD